MVNVAVCDDDCDILERMRCIIEKEYPCWRVDLFASGKALEEKLQRNTYTMYFFDIELGDGNGYDMAKKVRRKDPTAVLFFISSHEEYACDAFEVDALRFLRKPLEEQKVLEALRKAEEVLALHNMRLDFRKNGQEYSCKLSDIFYLERKQRRIELHLFTGEVIEIYGSLREFEKELKERNFSRCHQGYLLNLDYIKSIRESIVILENEEKIPLARSRRESFKKDYMDYCWRREERCGK